MPCTRIKIHFSHIHVIKSEEYGFFEEPGSSAEWHVWIDFLVDGQRIDYKYWYNEYTKDHKNYTIGQEIVIDIPSDSSLITIKSRGSEEDEFLSEWDNLPESSVILTAAENWKTGTGGVLRASTGDYNYEIFFTVDCLAGGTVASPIVTPSPLEPKKEPMTIPKCFIATAAYGSPVAPEVMAFRLFRDEVLDRSKPGRLFVKVYYLASPPLASLIRKSGFLRSLAKLFLNSVLRLLRLKRKHT